MGPYRCSSMAVHPPVSHTDAFAPAPIVQSPVRLYEGLRVGPGKLAQLHIAASPTDCVLALEPLSKKLEPLHPQLN